MQCVQDRNQSNVGSLNNVRRVASRHFRNKKKEYMKAKIEELETNNNVVTTGVVPHRCRWGECSDYKLIPTPKWHYLLK
jgi:hypothetical protein